MDRDEGVGGTEVTVDDNVGPTAGEGSLETVELGGVVPDTDLEDGRVEGGESEMEIRECVGEAVLKDWNSSWTGFGLELFIKSSG